MVLRVIIDVLMAVGLFFAVAGTKGILKMPDTFCRMQASTCVSTLGMMGVMVGAALYAFFVMGSPSAGVKVIVLCLLILTVVYYHRAGAFSVFYIHISVGNACTRRITVVLRPFRAACLIGELCGLLWGSL